MPIVIDGKQLLTPGEVKKKFEEYDLTDSKLRRLAQLGIIPSIPAGTRGKGPELRLYDEQVLDQLDPDIWKPLTRGVKKPGDDRYYSRIRRKAQA